MHENGPEKVTISEDEIDYILSAINRSFKKQLTRQNIVHSYSGVRPLMDDGADNPSEISRDYELSLETAHGPPLLNIFGGKLTTYRKLAEQAVDQFTPYFDHVGPPWTKHTPLPGGDITDASFNNFLKEKRGKYPWLPPDMLHRLARAYGTKINDILGESKSLEDLGEHYGDHLYESEIHYLIQKEWARTAEDILWRRSKLGLHIGKETQQNLERTLPQLLGINND